MNIPKIPWPASFYLILFILGKHINDVIIANHVLNPLFWKKLLTQSIIYFITGVIIITINRNLYFKFPPSVASILYFIFIIGCLIYFGQQKTNEWQIDFILFAIINIGIMSLFLKKGKNESN